MKKRDFNHYYPNYRIDINIFQSVKGLYSDLKFYRHFIYQLIIRDFTSTYKRSIIGFFWIFLTPVLQIVTWVFLKRTDILNPGELSIPYPAYLIIGTLVWGLFINLVNSTMTVFTQSRMMLLRTKVPFELFFISQVIVKLVPFVVSVILCLSVFLFLNVPMSPFTFLFPISILPIVFFATGIGMLISLITSLSYDIKRVALSFFNLLMFFTPVVYSLDKIETGLFRKIILLNPMTYFITFARDLIFGADLILPKGLVISAIISLLLILCSWRILNLTYNKLLERIY